jgi:hypothetical protein
MASNNPQVNSSDPSVAQQVQRENAALQSQRQAALSSAPSVTGSSNATTTTVSRSTRSVAPVVGSSEVLYPQSTTTTSSNSVTINSSVNNDVGDVTTVYSTNGQITVNPINQTINQYTSVDSGVSQIVAGSGVTITSTGASGTGVVTIGSDNSYSNSNVASYLPTYTGNVGAGNVNVTGTVYTNGISSTGLASLTILNVSTTANLGAPGNVKITGGTNGYVLQTDGAGNLTWTAQTGGGGNGSVAGSNTQIQFNDAGAFGGNTGFTFNKTTGIFTAPFLAGNGNGLSNIQGANVSGFVPNANVANTAFAVAGANVSGFVPNANVANTAFAVAAANVSGLGNIATANLDGSNANVLYGNGVFAPVSGGAGGLPLANGNSNFNIATANGNATVTTAGTQTWTFDTTGNLTIPGTITSGNTITIDNRASGNGADINLYSADDILIQARDRDAGSTSEGGDINIFAGDSAEDSDTSGGDIVIEAGRGGASNIDYGGTGGFVSVSAGQGGNAVGANFAARPGGSLTLNAGNAGTNNGNIDLGNSGGTVTINAGDSTGNGDPGGDIILRSGDAGANALAGQVQIIVPSSDEGNGGTWTFNGSGIIQLPNSGTIGNDGNNIDIGSTSAISLEAASAVNIYTDTGTAAWQWQFQDDGNLRLPTIELDVGNTINEQTVIQSQRKIIPGLRYSAEINGTTPTVVYTATSIDTTSMKVAMQIQHTGLGFEFFDVSATSTGGNTFYTVSNRVQPPTIDNSTVVVDLNGSNIMEITVTINSGAANSWVTYDATEFGIAVD